MIDLKALLADTEIFLGLCDISSLEPAYASDKFKRVVGETGEDINAFLTKNSSKLHSSVESIIRQFSPIVFTANIKEDKTRRALEFKVALYNDNQVLISATDITELKKLTYSMQSYSAIIEKQSKELHQMAYSDQLTGASNRRALFEYYSKCKDKIEDLLPLSICILDIDHFKNYNDRYGHEFGDHVLKFFTQKVSQTLDENCFFSRIGGEEFCLLGVKHNSEELNSLVDGILNHIKDDHITSPDNDTTRISFSAGIAEYGVDGKELDELLNNADKALYYAKAAGRSRVITFSTDIFEKRDDTLIPKFRREDR